MDYQKIIDTIFELNEGIRYAGLIDETGSLIVGGMRHGIDSIVDQPSEELYLTHTALRKSMRERFDDTMGKARFVYVEREKLSLLTFYLDKKMLLITLEPNLESQNVIDLAEDILDIVSGNKA
ncbi:hypothetical protein NMY3_00447 [Candidatus Nitrosocosmicus oleophilus]|jgi:hypothetical protein|uniref:Roadblock/LC7 domain protein n=1 Tax=Candidatus Nitrosocosmicus oleophilus TaxID=1353260 RepID=A0A654LV28_9ARCH|nr:DUF6659 family protein [Candidatus Nitrosocosmicus oleophilus]ALI34660.1 hypothetical protein NMY3_00447 [Candidatus Nitrosocosmicus oleophilus]